MSKFSPKKPLNHNNLLSSSNKLKYLCQDLLDYSLQVSEFFDCMSKAIFTEDQEKVMSLIEHDEQFTIFCHKIEGDVSWYLTTHSVYGINVKRFFALINFARKIEDIADGMKIMGQVSIKLKDIFSGNYWEKYTSDIIDEIVNQFKLFSDYLRTFSVAVAKTIIKNDEIINQHIDQKLNNFCKEILVQNKQLTPNDIRFLYVIKKLEQSADKLSYIASEATYYFQES